MKAKNLLKMAVAAFLISGMSASNAMAADSIGQAEALVVIPISIGAAGSPLDFGGIVSQAAAGSVEVDAAGAATSGTHDLVVPTISSSAAFAVSGAASTVYTASVTNATLTGAGTDMIATLQLSQLNAGSTLDLAGSDTITVFGSLAVGAAQAVGPYSGPFTVTVNY
jgi:uncharacterized protein DUF4402